MTKILTTFLALLCLTLHSQDTKIRWGATQKYSNSQGMFYEHLGENEEYFYLLFSDTKSAAFMKPRDRESKNPEWNLVAVSKSKLAIDKTFPLKGFGAKSDKKGLEFFKCVAQDDAIYLFYTEDIKKTMKVYMRILSKDLAPLSGYVEVWEDTWNEKNHEDLLTILHNDNTPGRFIVGSETREEEGTIKFHYTALQREERKMQSAMLDLKVKRIKQRGALAKAREELAGT